MRRKRAGTGVLWLALGGVVLVSFVVFAALLGPVRALKIAAAAGLSVAVDGFAEDPGPHRIPVIDVRVDPAYLDTLGADLPWSGEHQVPATLVHNGVHHKVKFRFRGSYTPSHFLGGKRSFRLSMKKSGPFAPYRKLNVINPKALNLLNNHLGNWIAGRMGVATPYDEMVFTRLNGQDLGVMEMFEQVDGTFEQVRGLATHQVPVYRGEFPPVVGRALPDKRQLWRSAANWEYTSDADSILAHQRLKALVDVVGSSTMDLAVRRDSLAKLIDVEAYLHYMAAILVVNTRHMDQFHNQWLVMGPEGLFYPIWWDGLLMFPPENEPLYYIHDALAFWILQVPEWRLRRDRLAWWHLTNLHAARAFEQELDRTIQRVMPSVLADRNKYGNVTLAPEDVHRNSLVHVIGSLAGMRASVAAYWDRSLARLRANDVTVDRTDSLRIRSRSEAAIRLTWPAREAESAAVYVNGLRIDPELKDGTYTVVLHRTLKLRDGVWNRPFVNWEHYIVVPLDARISFDQGLPAGLRITNAITDEAIR